MHEVLGCSLEKCRGGGTFSRWFSFNLVSFFYKLDFISGIFKPFNPASKYSTTFILLFINLELSCLPSVTQRLSRCNFIIGNWLHNESTDDKPIPSHNQVNIQPMKNQDQTVIRSIKE